MKKYLSTVFMLFSIVTLADTELNFSGQLRLKFNEVKEMDVNPYAGGIDADEYYSTSGDGNIFGTGDWKGSTMDNLDDNAEKFQAVLDMGLEAKINDKVKLYLSVESLTENFTGIINGNEITEVQEGSTVRDNEAFMLKEVRADIDLDYADVTVTNSFNYDFNQRVLAMQLEDNWGEPTPYGEGIYAKGKGENIDFEAFLFQSSDKDSADSASTNYQKDYRADYLVYGVDMKKEFSNATLEFLGVNTHDKSSDVGENQGDKLDTQHYALTAQYDPLEFLTLKGEYIRAEYGDDVMEMDNFISNVLSWYPSTYDLSTKKTREDNDIYEVSATIRPYGDIEINAGYKDVGEDYYAVLGSSQQMDSWLGDASFDANEGLGYEKGVYGDISFYLPLLPMDIKNTISYEDFDKTRSALDDNEDTNEQELKVLFEYGDADGFALNTSYRRATVENGGSGTVKKTDLLYNDFNVNGSYRWVKSDRLSNTFGVDLNYYTGTDDVLAQNFSNESRIKVSSVTEYKVNEKITVKGIYRFGYATEDNDVVQDASGMQNLVKAGMAYKIGPNCVLDLFYKYENYKLDREATAEELANSVYKKEAGHQWYDGAESWQHSGGTYDDWMKYVTPDYKGYENHEISASLVLKF